MIELLQNFALPKNREDLILAGQLVLFQNFNRIKPPSVFLASKDYFAEATSADHFYLFEIDDSNFAFLGQVDPSLEIDV